MEKLTREQRNQVYKMAKELRWAPKEINRNFPIGLCFYLSKSCRTLFEFDFEKYNPMIKMLPEFKKFAPKKVLDIGNCTWFKSEKERLNCINKCIEETNP